MNDRDKMFVKTYGNLIDKALMKPIIEAHLNMNAINGYDLTDNEIAEVLTDSAHHTLKMGTFNIFMELYYK